MTKITLILISLVFGFASVASAHPGSLHDHRFVGFLHYITEPFHLLFGILAFLAVFGVLARLGRKLLTQN